MSLYCAELLNKWSASDPAYSVDTMARSAEYASQAAQLYESIDIQGDIPTMEKFSQVDIPRNHLATEFSMNHICRAEFWEILPNVLLEGIIYSTLQKFSNVSLLLNS